jgi:MSHA biogenesis protein MshM
MDTYEHFKLNKPPFDLHPDVDSFFETPGHAEALATLQYVVHADKGSCVVVGDSGSGKTLLARMVAETVANDMPILWVPGGGQPSDQTNASVYCSPPRGTARGETARQTTLTAETHTAAPSSGSPLLIVDCADELPPRGWADVIAWFTNAIHHLKPANLLLFGLPRLLDMLASPELVRLQARVFRVCRLEPLSIELSKDYILARVALAGGDARRVFSDEVIERVARLGNGIPARINQLCDNALVEAFGAGHHRVTNADVGNALHVMLRGRSEERAVLPAPRPSPRAVPPPARGSPPRRRPAVRPKVAVPPKQPPAPAPIGELGESVDTRLRRFTNRLSQVLNVIHEIADEDVEKPSAVETGLRAVATESATV